jgi:hypothetical protein
MPRGISLEAESSFWILANYYETGPSAASGLRFGFVSLRGWPRSEHAAHIRSVVGSTPTVATIHASRLAVREWPSGDRSM